MDAILTYLKDKYAPETMILYGSYADGSNNAGSDFDALLIADCPKQEHDVSFCHGTQLDVFVYPREMTFRPEEFVQLYHGKVELDLEGKGEALMARVKTYIDNRPRKTAEEIRNDLTWCEKMLARTTRRDAEGYYRWHWILCDSLEFYCDIRKEYYFGPKKALRMMERDDPEAFSLYSQALCCLEKETLENWVNYLKSQMEG